MVFVLKESLGSTVGEMAKTLDVDYLIIGSGAMSLAFADQLLQDTDCTMAVIDRRAAPGGHWNDVYPFVKLHQPASMYGVNSLTLGDDRIDTDGLNAGMLELATGAEVMGYFSRVMNEVLLPSGRVQYFPMSNYRGDHIFSSLVSGESTRVNVARKTVDGTFFQTSVPMTHKRPFTHGPKVDVVSPNGLAQMWRRPELVPPHYAILGGGKTAMDSVIWLIEAGVDPESISWVMPREAWLLNRAYNQPAAMAFSSTMGGVLNQMEAIATADTVTSVFDALEASQQVMRIDPDVEPEMYHCAMVSEAELEILRRVKRVIRKGRVNRIESRGLLMERGTQPMPPGTLYVDCTASAWSARTPRTVFQDNVITLQMLRSCQPCFSAAVIAAIEAGITDQETQNAMASVVPLPDTPADLLDATLFSMMNQHQWGQNRDLNRKIRNMRLNCFRDMLSEAQLQAPENVTLLNRLRDITPSAIENIHKLKAQLAAELMSVEA